MKNLVYILALAALIPACSNPDKETVTEADSLQNKIDTAAQRPILADTVSLDTLTAKSVFSQEDSSSYFILTNYFKDPEIVPERKELQVVDSTCAVIVYPTDEQLESLKTETGEKFMEFADNYSYYQGIAIEMLDSIDIGTVKAETRYITFKGPRKKLWELDVRKDGAPAWNLIFFKPNKDPEIISITALSRDKIMDYFERKGE